MGGSQMVGGYKKKENHDNDESVQKAAQFAVSKISEKESQTFELVKIQSAHTQVVAGTNYKVVLDVATPEQKIRAFQAVIYEPLGGQDLQLTEHKPVEKDEVKRSSEASSERGSGALLGGYKEAASDDKEAKEAAEFAVQQLSQQSNSLAPLELKKIVNAKEKVEEGKKWQLKLELSHGKQEPKVYDVEVARSLQNQFTLVKASN